MGWGARVPSRALGRGHSSGPPPTEREEERSEVDGVVLLAHGLLVRPSLAR